MNYIQVYISIYIYYIYIDIYILYIYITNITTMASNSGFKTPGLKNCTRIILREKNNKLKQIFNT